MNKKDTSPLYRVLFYNCDKVYEIYTKHVFQSELGGFVELEEMVFKNSQILLDPAEEKLKTEFDSVKRTFVPLYNIIRIDEVDNTGTCKIYQYKNERVAIFPKSGGHKLSPSDK